MEEHKGLASAQRQREAAARELGKAAFDRGAKAIPALDVNLTPLLGPTVGGAIGVLDAWASGWHTANLSAPVL